MGMNVSAVSEIIEDGTDGILIEQQLGESLANGVKKMMENFPLRALIIQIARSKV